MIKNAVIVSSSTNVNLEMFNNDNNIFIGIERGALHLIEKGFKIDYALGDFDKVLPEELELIKSVATNFEIASVDKDYLDGELAIIKAREIGAQNIVFIANPTKRYDKNLSIFGLIFKYDIKFINDETSIFKIKAGETKLPFENYQNKTYVTFVAKEKTIISIKGLKYEATNLEIDIFGNECISNAFIPYQDAMITTNKDIICIMTK
ncbi:thiamine diphosphokinase [Mesoplasma photuris]|uniref:thiamine diphosphokinase n=1 Tax=Mesoplasma photuris TaxID=217731 RepID=UPI0004E21590|nr:thiamine diphosphokinase [Mesoplasma photuris]